MCLKTPEFWYEPNAPAVLMPLSCLYNALRRKGPSHAAFKARIPVLCIGNVTAGGGGKTPCALAVMDLIKDSGIAKNPCFLTRGYRGKMSGPLVVDPKTHSYRDVGDEALLLARKTAVIVSKNRAKGAVFAQDQGFDLIVMDDGFQNFSLHKDKSILVIGGETGFGNGALLPAGPLREPPEEALARADAVIIAGADRYNLRQRAGRKPVFMASAKTCAIPDSTKKYLAFCGLARPEKFRQTLEQSGLRIVDFIAYPDHHPYTTSDLEKLAALAARTNAVLITTAKDAVKLPASFPVTVLEIDFVFEDLPAVRAWLAGIAS